MTDQPTPCDLLVTGDLILTLPISLWSRHLERRSQYET